MKFLVFILLSVPLLCIPSTTNTFFSFSPSKKLPARSIKDHKFTTAYARTDFDRFKQVLSTHILENVQSIKSNPSFPHFVAGIVAGFVEMIVGHPFDTIRIRVMAGSRKFGGTRSQLYKAFQSPHGESGIFSLYRGSEAELLSSAIGGSLLFGVNDYLKRLFCANSTSTSTADSEVENTSKTRDGGNLFPYSIKDSVSKGLVFAAAGTGCIDGLVSKPLEMIKLRQQMMTNSGGDIDGTFGQATYGLMKEGGVAGLFRGWIPTVARETLGNAAFFVVYELTKQGVVDFHLNSCKKRHADTFGTDLKMTNENCEKEVKKIQTLAILIAGAAAGTGYVLASHPIETLSVLMQVDIPHLVSITSAGTTGSAAAALTGQQVYKYRYADVSECFKHVVNKKGFGGLYKGIAPTIFKSLPTYAASFLGYEYTLNFIESMLVSKKANEDSQ